METKYIFVTGGVVSGLGKGITAASLGRLLKQRGLKIAAQKLDPYMNIDPGTMSPFQHGEVFVTDDGAETDLDLGHYERFIDENLTKFSNLTSGKVYWNVLHREREGGYLGGTVQVIPHVTGMIKEFIYSSAKTTGAEVLITEIGGTTGDIESQPFLEAIRQISLEKGRENCLFIHVTLVPYLKCSGEHKSKPTQHSVKELRSMGISPNIIIARSDEPLSQGIKDKIALFCNVTPDCVIENMTVPSLYEAPLMLHENGLDTVVCRELRFDNIREPDLTEWRSMVSRINTRQKEVKIAIVGKYIQLRDAYLSIIESLNHAGFEISAKINFCWIDCEEITAQNAAEILKGVDGIIIPGGFGDRGVEGKIAACRYARESDTPFLGICLGMQIAVIEYARHVCGLDRANSSEFDEVSAHRVIDIMPGQTGKTGTGGTMRLGAYPCKIAGGSLLNKLYGAGEASERHRHRFEFNNDYRDTLTQNGLVISGTSPDGNLVEAVELPEKRFFAGVQFHPEFKSRPNKPHPLFLGLVRAAAGLSGTGA
ncbi:MAG: CTP synthase [Chitinispirillia bacterium]|nr:CTP synthase [Chitinispirillia bacterium]MCL2242762.1 CTP synthase [Chitinispirillia bacterium]